MKLVLYLFSIALLTITACQHTTPQKQNLEADIAALEAKLFSETNALVAGDADQLLKMYLLAADEVTSDSVKAEYLFKAADLMMYHADPLETIAIYERIIQNYPSHDKAVMSLFLKAFVYDTRIGDTASARQYYEEFLQRYPDDDFAMDASMAIQNLGKPVEDLIREFEAKNQ